jgi:UDP-N-acetylmuramoylalanine--D-glutamate ligase
VFENMAAGDTAVIDVDDPGSAPWAERVAARGVRVVRVSREGLLPGGVAVMDGVLTLDTPSGPVGLVPASDLRIRGGHNVSNALAAAAAAWTLGVSAEALRIGLASFDPIEHRLEPAGVIDGVEYFNDSKATNPDAVLKALTAFEERPIVVLLGGRNKGNSFDDLAKVCAQRCRSAVVFGEARAELAVALAAAGVPYREVISLDDAVQAAASAAHAGDVVLLSPACASFDQFDDYEQRGRVFKDLVVSLAAAGGSGSSVSSGDAGSAR